MKSLFCKYNILILVLFLAQVLFTFNSSNQIRYEELSESVRNVFWLENGLVFSGINSHLGWYTPLRLVYNVFGFSFEYVKYFRLFLCLVSIICLSLVLKQIFGFKRSLIPFVTIVLSPTLLFFNSLRNQYGVDLQYLPIILYFLTKISFSGMGFSFVPHILVWSLSMLAWSAYPAFVYYLPAVFIYYIYKLRKSESKNKIKYKYTAISFISFFLPITLMVLQVDNKQILVLDPNIGGGLFRGPAKLVTDPKEVIERIYYTLLGLIGLTQSYYYEVKEAELSSFFPLISVVTAVFLSLYLAVKKKIYRIYVILISLTFLVNLLVIGFLSDNSGLSTVRRATGILASFYAFYVLAWVFVYQVQIKKTLKYLIIFILLILPVHHLVVYPINLVHIKDLSPDKERVWLGQDLTPDESLKKYVDDVQKHDLRLYIKYPDFLSFGEVYNWIYSSIEGKCRWNRLNCYKIYGFDTKKGKFIELTLDSVNYTHK